MEVCGSSSALVSLVLGREIEIMMPMMKRSEQRQEERDEVKESSSGPGATERT